MNSHQILLRKQRDRAMNKLVWRAAQGDEKFLMKDINCEYEYDQLRKMRVRAENERRNDAATKIQRWHKTKRSNALFKVIVSSTRTLLIYREKSGERARLRSSDSGGKSSPEFSSSRGTCKV
jgi:hypothetical protein